MYVIVLFLLNHSVSHFVPKVCLQLIAGLGLLPFNIYSFWLRLLLKINILNILDTIMPQTCGITKESKDI